MISALPVPLQPFQGQEVQVKVIAVRGWRKQGDFQFASQPLEVPKDDSLRRPLVTTSLGAGEFIAVSNGTAAHFNKKLEMSIDDPSQSHIIIPSLQKSLESVGASLQDSIKIEGYYFGTTRKD